MTETQRKKQILYSYQDEVARADRIHEQIVELRGRKTSISINLDGMPHGNQVSDLSNYAARYDELYRMYLDALDKSANRRVEISRAIEDVASEAERAVLTKRYLDGKVWEQIAYEMHYSRMQVNRIHGHALMHIKL